MGFCHPALTRLTYEPTFLASSPSPSPPPEPGKNRKSDSTGRGNEELEDEEGTGDEEEQGVREGFVFCVLFPFLSLLLFSTTLRGKARWRAGGGGGGLPRAVGELCEVETDGERERTVYM